MLTFFITLLLFLRHFTYFNSFKVTYVLSCVFLKSDAILSELELMIPFGNCWKYKTSFYEKAFIQYTQRTRISNCFQKTFFILAIWFADVRSMFCSILDHLCRSLNCQILVENLKTLLLCLFSRLKIFKQL